MTNAARADLVVRRLQRSDLKALLALYAHLHADDDPSPDDQRLEAVWDSIVKDDNHIYLGGFLGNELVGACTAAVIANLTRGARPYAVVENVVTHAGHRRTGVGTRVMRELIEECRRRGCYKVMLMSATTRAPIHGFYESLGFDRKAKQAFVINMR